MEIEFDYIAEVICRNCDWFGLKQELITVAWDDTVFCPVCGLGNDLEFAE